MPADGHVQRRRLDTPRTPGPKPPRIDSDAFGRASENVARYFGTARFLVIQTVIVAVWIIVNVSFPSIKWDPYPFILLNLAFSTQAAYAAPFILLAQNRQADRDRVSLEQDRQQAGMMKAATDFITIEIADLRRGQNELATREYLRAEVARLLDDMRAELVTQIRAELEPLTAA